MLFVSIDNIAYDDGTQDDIEYNHVILLPKRRSDSERYTITIIIPDSIITVNVYFPGGIFM